MGISGNKNSWLAKAKIQNNTPKGIVAPFQKSTGKAEMIQVFGVALFVDQVCVHFSHSYMDKCIF